MKRVKIVSSGSQSQQVDVQVNEVVTTLHEIIEDLKSMERRARSSYSVEQSLQDVLDTTRPAVATIQKRIARYMAK